MKKTAVEFLVESLLYLDNEYDMGFIDKNEYQSRRKLFIEQAKAKEKWQLRDSWFDGLANLDTDWTFEQYYNETYGKDESNHQHFDPDSHSM